ncbi:energy transducer TonB family protein [Chitinolyticbacter meiyuanensis]|uniref:energy transducer TonB family protein n=1 Tax=Chitinolyticbacter meiyuanensis TaxID=682798 RepID=UPI001C9E4BB1|nr:energy transducer TonB [Chitinolyticbacter meiyuanensis]
MSAAAMALTRTGLPRWFGPLLGVLVLALLGWLVWHFAHDQSGMRREAPTLSTIVPLPPQPTPPPPEEQPPEETQPEQEVPEVAPKPLDAPKPDDAPKPANDAAQPMTMDAAGQAGNDGFNIGAGSGGGMGGTGNGGTGGNATYGQYLSYALQRRLQSDERTRRLVFRLQVDIWLDAQGRLTDARLVSSSGNPDTDAAVLATLRDIGQLDERPSASQHFPARVAISGRRPG